jgi:hypothetical protein
MLPSSVAAYVAKGLPAGNGHTNGNGHVPALTAGPGAAGDGAGHGHG